jgi:flap endonuclease-1
MGIANLNEFLRKNCIEVFEEIHISEYAYMKVAIDTSLFLCKFKAIHHEKWLEAFISLVSCMRRNEIHCVFIYDNGSPPEKEAEKAERRAQQEKNKQRVIELETSLEKYYNTGVLENNLVEIYNKCADIKPKKRLLSNVVTKDNTQIDVEVILEKIAKMRKNILNISQKDFDLTKELFDILKIPYFNAPMEAETCCADLCKRGYVDAVMSEDTDVLAYSAPVFLTKIDVYKDKCIRIHHDDVLKALGLTDKQFLDLCIMFGCDYNKNIYKVGPVLSYRHIRKYGSIDEIENKLDIDVSNLNYVRTRQLFTEYERIDIKSIPFCGIPDVEKLEKFVLENCLNVNFEKLKKDFTHNNIIIEE